MVLVDVVVVVVLVDVGVDVGVVVVVVVVVLLCCALKNGVVLRAMAAGFQGVRAAWS